MVDQENHPVAWAMLTYELDDAYQDLGILGELMRSRGHIGEEEFRVRLGHIYAHLNRAWNGRNNSEDAATEAADSQRRFPGDLDPI